MSIVLVDDLWSKFDMDGSCVVGHPHIVKYRTEAYALHQAFSYEFCKINSNQLHFRFLDGRNWKVTYHAATIDGPVSFQTGNTVQWQIPLLSRLDSIMKIVDDMRIDLSMTIMDTRPI